MKWEPIETAPKDGREVMCAWYLPVFKKWTKEVCVFRDGCWQTAWDDQQVHPTYYQPMPEDPEDENG